MSPLAVKQLVEYCKLGCPPSASEFRPKSHPAHGVLTGQWVFVWQGWLSLLAGAAAIPAFRQFARAMALETIDTAR
jgi:hypothetical protein